MKNKFHTIVTDLDGTLLNNKSEITALNKSILQKAMNSGIQLIIATGRRFYSANRFASYFDGIVEVISNNGQILRLSPSGERIQANYIKENIAKTIIMEGRKFHYTPILHVDEYESGLDIITEFKKEERHNRRLGKFADLGE